jgi:hypothetical protein
VTYSEWVTWHYTRGCSASVDEGDDIGIVCIYINDNKQDDR